MLGLVLYVAILAAPVLLYIATIVGVSIVARRRGLPPLPFAVGVGVAIGVVAGRYAVSDWPQKTLHWGNAAIVLLGDAIHDRAIQAFGDPTSLAAGHTVPEILQLPALYFLAALLLWSLVGLASGAVVARWPVPYSRAPGAPADPSP